MMASQMPLCGGFPLTHTHTHVRICSHASAALSADLDTTAGKPDTRNSFTTYRGINHFKDARGGVCFTAGTRNTAELNMCLREIRHI